METELYEIMQQMLFDSQLSKRKFCSKYEIPHTWYIEFMNPTKPFRPMQTKTMSLLHNNLKIPVDILQDYNTYILESRSDTNGS